MHLGKHGTLEWLPGKWLGLSAGCAPDAALGALPLFYPFVVNDPGEGEQAKRRAHAMVVDHLVPPMARADTYDELARLEQLLDEYFHVESLDPAKLPAVGGRIWELLREAELHRDLEVEERPDEERSATSSSTSTATCARSRTCRSATACTCSARRRRARPGWALLAAVMRLGAGRRAGPAPGAGRRLRAGRAGAARAGGRARGGRGRRAAPLPWSASRARPRPAPT